MLDVLTRKTDAFDWEGLEAIQVFIYKQKSRDKKVVNLYEMYENYRR